jgi:hypothetical protein
LYFEFIEKKTNLLLFAETFFCNLIDKIPKKVTTTFLLDACSASGLIKNTSKTSGKRGGGNVVVFAGQGTEDGRFMQEIIAPIVRSQTAKMTNQQLFFEDKRKIQRYQTVASVILLSKHGEKTFPGLGV